MKNKKTIIIGLGILVLILAPIGIYSGSIWESKNVDLKQDNNKFKEAIDFQDIDEEAFEAE